MHFDLTDLRLFVAIVDAGSITAGAERVGLSLASASTRVRGMEHQSGAALLERGRRGVQMTPPGRVLLHHARLVLRQVERMRGDLGEYARGLKGRVRLLANTAALGEFLPEVLAGFLTRYPNVDIELDECASEGIVQAVADERADIGVAADHVNFSDLTTLPFRKDRLVLAVAAGHPLYGREQIEFAESLNSEFIGLTGDSALQQRLTALASRAGGRMRIRAQVRGLEVVCRMVALGAGVAVVPEAAANRIGHLGGLSLIRLTDSWAERQLRVVIRSLEHLPLHARRLAEYLSGSDPIATEPVL